MGAPFAPGAAGASPRFAQLWAEGSAAAHRGVVQTVPDAHLRIIVCTHPADSTAAEELARLRAAAPAG